MPASPPCPSRTRALRAAGLDMPLVLDAPTWGQDIDTLQAVGPALIAHDPRHNLMLSVHMWWHDPAGERVRSELAESVALGGVANADCADQGRFDMTLDGRFGNFTEWGEKVAISHPRGIQSTAVRPRWLAEGRCP